jgi:lysozyme
MHGGRRRWLWVLSGTVVVVAIIGAATWFLFVPSWRPALHEGERYGVDVSAHQGAIDWQRVLWI